MECVSFISVAVREFGVFDISSICCCEVWGALWEAARHTLNRDRSHRLAAEERVRSLYYLRDALVIRFLWRRILNYVSISFADQIFLVKVKKTVKTLFAVRNKKYKNITGIAGLNIIALQSMESCKVVVCGTTVFEILVQVQIDTSEYEEWWSRDRYIRQR